MNKLFKIISVLAPLHGIQHIFVPTLLFDEQRGESVNNDGTYSFTTESSGNA